MERGITNDLMSDILVTAFEGGINYWCHKVKLPKTIKDEHLNKCASDLLPMGYNLMLFDAESDDKWELTREKVINGIIKWLDDKNIHNLTDEVVGDIDADEADAIIQYAVFNELVFG